MSTATDEAIAAAPQISSPGEIVRVWQRHDLVEDVVRPRRKLESTLVRLSCIEDGAQGQQLEVLWERELHVELLGVSANTVRAWALSGKLQEYRPPVNNDRLLKRDEVQALLEQIANPEPVSPPKRRAK